MDEKYNPITAKQFTAKFDGDRHEIKLTINVVEENGNAYAGVFGYLGKGGEIKNLGVAKGSYISASGASSYVGGIAGGTFSTTISGCYNTGAVSATADSSSSAGGIAGFVSGAMSGCYNTGAVSATAITGSDAGGIVGKASGKITGCYNTGAVSATASSSRAGGIVGYASGTISGCYYLAGSAQKGVGNKAEAEVTGSYEGKSLADMQAEEFVGKLNKAITEKPDGVTQVFEFIAGRTPALWWEKAEIDAALAEVGKVEGVLGNLKGNGVDTSGAEGKLEELKKSIELAALNELPGLVEAAKKEILPLALDAVEKVGAEAGRLKDLGVDISEEEEELKNIKNAMEGLEVSDAEFSGKLKVQTDALEAVALKLAKAEALDAVEKVVVEVDDLGNSHNADVEQEKGQLEAIKDAINSATTADEIKKQVAEAQKVRDDLKPELRNKALDAVEKVGEEAERLKDLGVNIGKAEEELENIKNAIEGLEVSDAEFSGKLKVQTDALEVVALKLAKAEAIDAVGKVNGEVDNLGNSHNADVKQEKDQLKTIKDAINSATTADEIKKQVQAAQKLLEELKLKLAKAEALAAVEKVKGEARRLKDLGANIGEEEEEELKNIKNTIDGLAVSDAEFSGKLKEQMDALKAVELKLAKAEAEAIDVVGKVETEVGNLGESHNADVEQERRQLEAIKNAINSATTVDEVKEQVAEAQKLLEELKLKLAKLDALAAVKKIEAEITKLGQLYDEDTSEKLRSLDEIKVDVLAGPSNESQSKVVEAQNLLANLKAKVQGKELNLGHVRSSIGGQAGFYKAKNGVVTFRVVPNPGYKISEIITSGSRLIRPGSVVTSVPERVKVSFEKV